MHDADPGFVDLVIGQPLVDFLERHARLEACQPCTQAEVYPEAEGEMPLHHAVDVEAFRRVEVPRIVVGGAD